MNREEFVKQIPLIDARLVEDGIPVHARSFRAFRLLAPTYSGPMLGYGIDRRDFGEYEGPNLLEKINAWYKDQYGSRFNAPTDRGKVPVLLRNEIFLIRIPLAFGRPEIQILPPVNGLTPAMAKSLSSSECEKIRNHFVEGYGLTYEFEDLSSQIEADARNGIERKDNPFLASALGDKITAADCLEGNIDTNGAVFHSQQLAEKMLKAILLHAKSMSEEGIKKRFNHRIQKVFEDVASDTRSPPAITSAVQAIARYGMDIRYTSARIEKAEAVNAFWAGLRVGGWCATLLSGNERRVSP